MDRGGQTLYYHHDALWSVHALSNASGVLVEGYRYDAYGYQTVFTPGANGMVEFGGDDQTFVGASSSLGNPYTFTGRERDGETGLLFYRARHYDAVKGRFAQRDPMGYADAMNLYEYVRSSPVNFTDPFGLLPWPRVAPTPFWDKECCKVDSITVEKVGTAVASHLKLDIFWGVKITGEDLRKCEYTQFISNDTSMWDAKGEALSKAGVLDAYRSSAITTSSATNPFSQNEKDDGWGNGDDWEQFTDDRTETIEDRHRLNVPWYRDGAEQKRYAFTRKVKAVIQVRTRALKEVRREHDWEYEFRNFAVAADAKPRAPIDEPDGAGFYGHRGISGTLPWDMAAPPR
jgi:RHS repeat-associated protein